MTVVIEDSCILVYTTNRIGRANSFCNMGSLPNANNPRNNRKFELNGCSKVDRVTDCSLKLMRG